MKPHERQLVLDQFRATHARLNGLVESLKPAQWKFSPGDGRWSIAECVEHVTAVEYRVTTVILRMLGSAGDPAKLEESAGKDTMLLSVVPSRAQRLEAPAQVRPTGRWPEPADLLAAFHSTRAKTIQFVETTPADLRAFTFQHAYFGELDGYQWLLTLAGHGERHARQIEEVQQHPEFPKA